MSRYNLDEHRARIINCATKDQLIDAVSDMCNCAGYPFDVEMSIKGHAERTFLVGQVQLSRLLEIAAKRERTLQ